MRKGRFLPRILTLFLAFNLALPGSVLALRQTGLEESEPLKKRLVSALTGGTPQAGLEETKQRMDQLEQLITAASESSSRDDEWGFSDCADQALEILEGIWAVPEDLEDRYFQILIGLMVVFSTKLDAADIQEDSPLALSQGIVEEVRDILERDHFKEKIAKDAVRALVKYKGPFDKKASNRLRLGGAVVRAPWKSLESLWRFQKKIGRDELGFLVFSTKTQARRRSLIIVDKGGEAGQRMRLRGLVPYGHTHGFSVPLEVSPEDIAAAKMSNMLGRRDAYFFVLAFGRDDGHVEMAIFSPETSRWEYERRDQGKIAGRLREIGLLAGRQQSGLEEGVTAAQEMPSTSVKQAQAVIREFLGSSRQAMKVGKVALIGPGALEGSKGLPALWPLLIQAAPYLTPEERSAVVVYTENVELAGLLRELGYRAYTRFSDIQAWLPSAGVTLYTTPEEELFLRGQLPQVTETILLTPSSFPQALAHLLKLLGYVPPSREQLEQFTNALGASA